MKKGEIWWATLDDPRGSEPGYRRPVVIISSDEFNKSKIQTVIVATITSNLRLGDAPGNFQLMKQDFGLPKDSVVNVSQVLTLDKSFLTKPIGQLSIKKMLTLNDGLKLVLSI